MTNVLIYRSRILPISETFVLDHYTSLSGVNVAIAGIRQVNGIDTRDLKILTQFERRPSKTSMMKYLLMPQKSALMNRIKEFKPDVIHAHFAIDAAEIMPIAKAINVPLIVTLHGYDVNSTTSSHLCSRDPYRIMYVARKKRLLSYASLFLAVSQYVKESALNTGYPEHKLRVHRLGINPSLFAAPKDASEETSSDVLFVGRMVEKKGLIYLIKAAEHLAERGIKPKIRVIGEGPLRGSLELAAAKTGADLKFLGAKARKDVLQYLRNTRVLCMPSVRAADGDNEGLPIVALEAQASGVPVVGFAQGPILEAVENGRTGLLAKTGDSADLATQIFRLIDDRELQRQMGQAGAALVSRDFNINKQALLLGQLYSEISKKGKSPT